MSKKPNTTAQSKKRVLTALGKSLGVVKIACEKAGVSRTQFYKWLKNDSRFRKKVEEVEDLAIDFVESQLFQNIKSGNVPSIIFYLKTKGRKRGYITKTEIEGNMKTEITGIRFIKADSSKK